MSSSIPASTPGKLWQPPAPEDLAPALPAYEILGLLGHGGMGAVYKARQNSLNREVAIKILHPMAAADHGSMHLAERFKSEAQAMARLNHPGIVAVYDAGQTPGGLLFFVMEMVQGTDVAQMIRSSGKLPPEHAYAITAHVCDALAYAHQNGVIHRDIKPANIMVDTKGQVKVADFGLAKALDSQASLTHSNMAVGTPDFVAPEAMIPGLQVDGRADLYAVGVMLYQMLTGHIPRGAWQPASVVAPGTDPRFDQVIAKAMAYDRERRHRSACELRQHLDTLFMPAVSTMDLQQYSSDQMSKTPQAGWRKGPSKTGIGELGAIAAHLAPDGSNTFATRAKPKTSMFIGIGAAAVIGTGAYLMLTKGEKVHQVSPAVPLGEADVVHPPETVPSPIKASEQTQPVAKPVAVVKSPEPAIAMLPKPSAPDLKKEESKPTTSAPPESRATARPDAARAPIAANAGRPPAAPSVLPAPAAFSPDTPGPTPSPFPAELAALDAQFVPLQKERVTAPFEADLAKLNSFYLGAIAKKIADEKAAGHLDGILALEAEQKLVRDKQFVADTVDHETPASLKALRVIYREQFAKIAATRAANLKSLIDPLDKRLAQMETEFTKSDHLADAKVVRQYRESLAESSTEIKSTSLISTPAGSAASNVNKVGLEPSSTLTSATTLSLKSGFTNTLGMKFLPVKGTDVLFCVHETRRHDYSTYSAEVPGVNSEWKNQLRNNIPCGDKDDHPVVGVSWYDAQKFCVWLSEKEGRIYRLPTDEEWSIAAGLGSLERHRKDTTPEMLNGRQTTEFPWGSSYPPRTKDKAGNYADSASVEKFPTEPSVEGYTDGFPTTSPVMSFKPNKLGLYDMGGNVWEWVEDWWNDAKTEKVLRGASFYNYFEAHMLSSYRNLLVPDARNYCYGFRVVLVVR